MAWQVKILYDHANAEDSRTMPEELPQPQPILNPLSLVSDEPVPEQVDLLLGMDVWSQIVADVATGTEGPFTIGLFAPWGQGKTSVLNNACHRASFAENTHAFVVNAWEHERHADALPAILQDVLSGIDSKLLQTRESSNRERLIALKKVFLILSLSIAAVSASAPALTLAIPAAADLIEQIRKAISDTQDGRKEMGDTIEKVLSDTSEASLGGPSPRALLEWARKTYLPTEKVIVFIDDLDRCHPDNAVALLESIKHLLWVPGFVFVLALDNEVLERYLQHRYEDKYGLNHDSKIGKRYLEKLVQLTIYLPESDKRFEEYVRHLLQPSEDSAWRLPQCVLEILVAGARNNPRALKRRVNDLMVDVRVFNAIQRDQSQKIDIDEVASFLAIHRLLRDELEDRDLRALFQSEDLRRMILVQLNSTGYDTSQLSSGEVEALESKPRPRPSGMGGETDAT